MATILIVEDDKKTNEAIGDEYTQVTSFDEQADDYMTKPPPVRFIHKTKLAFGLTISMTCIKTFYPPLKILKLKKSVSVKPKNLRSIFCVPLPMN